METYFASPERKDLQEITADFEFLNKHSTLREVLEVMQTIVLILNEDRQIIYCNSTSFELLGLDGCQAILGLRPGEALNCVHSADVEAGCGSGAFCHTCGAVNAILDLENTNTATRECRITTVNDGIESSLDLNVTASKVALAGKNVIMFSVQDISDTKRRNVLENIFFHDLLNTVSILQNSVELLSLSSDDTIKEEVTKLLPSVINRLTDEIQGQKQLMQAEGKILTTNIKYVSIGHFLTDLLEFYKCLDIGANKYIQIDEDLPPTVLPTDPTILGRIVGNMLKNALEATATGETINIGCSDGGEYLHFWVQNPQVMDTETQLQVFQRSFSTRGINRGTGTYSMKLLAEQYLQGKVWFVSNEEEGTIFTVGVPKIRK